MCRQERPPACKDDEVFSHIQFLLPQRQRQAELQWWNLQNNIADLDREIFAGLLNGEEYDEEEDDEEYDEEEYDEEEYDEEYEEEDYNEYYGEYEGYQEVNEENNENGQNDENGEEEYIPPPAPASATAIPNDYLPLTVPLPPSIASDASNKDEEDRQPDEKTRELQERLRLARERRAALEREIGELDRMIEAHNVE